MLKFFVAPIVLLLIFAHSASAQHYGQHLDISLNAGYATFNLDQLKSYQQRFLEQSPLPAKITNDFPGYLNLSLDAAFYDSAYYVGMMLGHTSTGGRIAYSDYSGSYDYDQLVRMTYAGVFGGFRILETKAGAFFFGATLLTYLNRVDLKYTETVADDSYAYTTKLWSVNLSFGPYLQYQKRVGKLTYKASAGYEFHYAPNLFFRHEDSEEYVGPDGQSMNANASGARFNVGVGYALFTRRSPF